MSIIEMIKAFIVQLINAFIFGAFKKVYADRQYFRYFLKSKFKLRKEKIRISISALARIQIDDKLLLVRGNRIKHQFQPVGGVLKFYKSAKTLFNEMGVSADYASFGYDKEIKDDLRIILPAKYLIKFLRWYNKKKDRETDPNREFYEELVKPGFLSAALFPHISTNYIRQILPPIHFSPHFRCNELLIAEIYELLPSPDQEIALRNTMETQCNEYKWVTETIIRRRGYNPASQQTEIIISETAEWILNN